MCNKLYYCRGTKQGSSEVYTGHIYLVWTVFLTQLDEFFICIIFCRDMFHLNILTLRDPFLNKTSDCFNKQDNTTNTLKLNLIKVKEHKNMHTRKISNVLKSESSGL